MPWKITVGSGSLSFGPTLALGEYSITAFFLDLFTIWLKLKSDPGYLLNVSGPLIKLSSSDNKSSLLAKTALAKSM